MRELVGEEPRVPVKIVVEPHALKRKSNVEKHQPHWIVECKSYRPVGPVIKDEVGLFVGCARKYRANLGVSMFGDAYISRGEGLERLWKVETKVFCFEGKELSARVDSTLDQGVALVAGVCCLPGKKKPEGEK